MASLRPFNTHLSIIIVLTFLTVSGITFSDDAAVMSNLLAAISPAPSNWSNSTHYCSWTHVTCDDDNNVISIKIDSLSISGQLFSGITQLSSLINLSVSGNSLSGPLPSFANMPMLEDLRLVGNNFSSVPSDFLSGLPRLKSFSVSENRNLSSWKIPTHLNRSANLVSFNASNANVFGIIPDFFDSFPKLENVILSFNNLTGSLPGSFSGSKIRILRLDNQQLGLSGTITVLSSMTQLSQVWLQGNAFTGQIPDLYGLQNLSDLRLEDNRLTGFIPDSLRNLTENRLRTVFLQNNKLQGPIPQFQFQVNLGNNSFCRETPGDCDPQVKALLNMAAELGFPLTLAESWTGNDPCRKWRFISCDVQGEVTTLDLEKQRFSGNISRILLASAKLTTLRKLYLNDNNLTGSISENLAILNLLQILDVSDNNLSGSVPDLPDSLRFNGHGNPLLRMNASNLAGKIAGIVLAVLVPVIVLVLFVSYRFYAKRLINASGRTARNQTTTVITVTGRITAKVDVYAFGVVLMEIITGKKALDETVPNETCHLVTWFHKVISKGHNFKKAIDPTLDQDEQTFESISKETRSRPASRELSSRGPPQEDDLENPGRKMRSIRPQGWSLASVSWTRPVGPCPAVFEATKRLLETLKRDYIPGGESPSPTDPSNRTTHGGKQQGSITRENTGIWFT
nr:receptor-like kinase TMK4 [Ipomoea batatas]